MVSLIITNRLNGLKYHDKILQVLGIVAPVAELRTARRARPHCEAVRRAAEEYVFLYICIKK